MAAKIVGYKARTFHVWEKSFCMEGSPVIFLGRQPNEKDFDVAICYVNRGRSDQAAEVRAALSQVLTP